MNIDAESVRVRSRYIERLDAAESTEMMLRDTSIECVGRNRILALQKPKIIPRYEKVQETALLADAAVTFRRLDIGRRLNLEFHRTAVATSHVSCHMLIVPAKQQDGYLLAWRIDYCGQVHVASQARRDLPGHGCHFPGPARAGPG